MKLREKSYTSFLIALLLTIACLFVSFQAKAAIKPGVRYAGGNLTIEAQNATLGEVLETIARTAGLDVYCARGFEMADKRITINAADKALEDVLRSILRGYNFAAIYVKEGDEFRIASLKIFPEGQQGGAVVPLFTGNRTEVFREETYRGETRTVMVTSGGEVTTHGNLARKGALVPSQTELGADAIQSGSLQSPWFAMKVQLEQEEAAKFQELHMLQKQVESTSDAERKRALMTVYADEVSKFYAMKKANINKVEALKRITRFKDITGR